MNDGARRALLFAGVSGLAFAVDMMVLGLLVHGLGWPATLARGVSIVAATSSSWLVHRHGLFARRAQRAWAREWARYLGASAIGMALNYGLYGLLVTATISGGAHPLLAIVPGGVLATALNYVLASRWVFSRQVLSSHR